MVAHGLIGVSCFWNDSMLRYIEMSQLFLFQRSQTGIGDDIACKVEDLLQQTGADVQHQADTAGDAQRYQSLD